MTTPVGFTGYAPQLVVGDGNKEAEKYGELWQHEEYRRMAPGESWVLPFVEHVQPKKGSTLIDFGCGTGRAGLALSDAGLSVTLMDFVRNCLDPHVQEAVNAGQLKFVKHDLEKPSPIICEYGFCTDVLEHIPPEKVGLVLDNLLRAAKHVWFAIALYEDSFGDMIGQHLHLTVQPYEWWLNELQRRGCHISYSACTHHGADEQHQHTAVFCATLWEDAQTVVEQGVLNSSEQAILENVKHNCAQGWQQIVPHETNDLEAMIVGGGPSLAQYTDEIREKRAAGVKLITLNGAYNWALENGLTPSATIIVDAREFNKRFTKPVVADCKYLIASQCHPEVLDGLPKDRTYLWHTMAECLKEVVPQFYPTSYPIPGGSTVLLRALPLMRTLGYHRFHLYGCDSCLADGAHHAYAQPENESQVVVPIMVNGGRVFWCHPWMASQAREWITLIEHMGEIIDVIVYGDGLLKHIVDVGASMATLDEGEE